jgi:Amidohydrolase family
VRKGLLGIGCLLLLAACSPGPSADLAIRDATVVDVANGTLHPNQTILVGGKRIVAVGATDTVRVPSDAEVIDAADGYLIPGLWDAHVHSAGSLEWHFPLYLAYGITSVRNMHTTDDHALERVVSIRSRVASGELLGPRFMANGGIVDGDPPVWPGSVVVRSAEEARTAVDRLVDGGADFVKVYDRLTPEAYFAVLKRAGERGLPVDGHLPMLVKPEEAVAAGQRTFEHTSGIGMGCSSQADAVRADYATYLEMLPEMQPYPDAIVAFFRLVRRTIDANDPELCRSTARMFRDYGVASVPTLVANAGSDPMGFVADPQRMERLPAAVREEWRAWAEEGDPISELLGPVDSVIVGRVRVLHEEGVTILAGTDVGNPFLVPGLSLHRELARLTEAGLSPLEALRSATLLPARIFGFEADRGTIETGKLADLVLLDANPLESIHNTQRIRAVVANGRPLRRADLDRLLTEAAAFTLPKEEQDTGEASAPANEDVDSAVGDAGS